MLLPGKMQGFLVCARLRHGGIVKATGAVIKINCTAKVNWTHYDKINKAIRYTIIGFDI